MPWGPELILNENNQLKTSTGNWVEDPGDPGEGFVWESGAAKLYQSSSWKINWGLLHKEFFDPIYEGRYYLLSFDCLRPSAAPDGDYTMGISSDLGISIGTYIPLAPLDEWIHIDYESHLISPFDFDTRRLHCRLFSREWENQYCFFKNVSLREWIEPPARLQYLPIMGIG